MEKAEIILKLYGNEYSAKGFSNDTNASELLDIFKRLMVSAGYGPQVLNNEDGHYVWESYTN